MWTLTKNPLHRGSVLTSALKNLDRAVYIALFSYQKGLWLDNLKYLGVAKGGVGIAIDQHNQNLITLAIRTKLEQAEQGILLGTLVVDGEKVQTTDSSSVQAPLNKPASIVIGASD